MKKMTYKTIWKLYKHQLSSKNVYLFNMVANYTDNHNTQDSGVG